MSKTNYAEVTASGVNKRGATKSKSNLVVVGKTTTGNLKKKLLYASTTLMYAALAGGILNDGLPLEFIKDGMYITTFLYLAQLLTIRFTKME